MSFLRSPSIQARALTLGLLPSGLLLVALLYFFTTVRLQDAQQDLLSKGELLAAQLATAAEYDVLTGNSEALQRLLSRTDRYDWVVSAEILNESGQTLARSGRVASPDPADLEVVTPIYQAEVSLQSDPFTDFSGLSGGTEPALADNRLVGEIRLTLGAHTLAEKRSRIIYSGLSIALVMLLIALILVRALVNSIAVPLESVYSALLNLESGRYGSTIDERQTTGQLEDLVRATNTLSQTLASKDQALTRQLRELQSARERAERASAAKGEFLTLMSHELKTPLNGVIGMLELLSETSLDDTQKDYIRTAIQSAEHLLIQINELLNISLMDRGKISLDTVPTQVTAVVEEVARAYQASAQEKGLEMVISHAPGPDSTRVLADPVRLRQLTGSLLAYAVKSTSSGAIRIRTQSLTQSAQRITFVLEVQDGSPVLSEAFLDTWSHSSRDTAFLLEALSSGSVSISLVLVAGLAYLMKGRLDMLAAPDGSGMIYQVVLPLQLAAPCAASPAGSSDHTPRFKGRVLVVEDNLVNQKVTLGILKKLGVETRACYDGQEALDLCNKEPFDLILMDCQMPVMDGFQATREIRLSESRSKSRHTPIVALTANAIEGAEEACLEAGMDDFIEKPVRTEQLAAVLSKWLAFSAPSDEDEKASAG
ncbi:MAG: response regulator [Gammaproteobacteria bacterium]|nr:MAG: response regulator [Gammaproteobacteria bacterium]